MHEIDSYISHLLFHHDCVILPGFGGIVGNAVPSKMELESYTFYPPSKRLSFNRSLDKNDGLLAHEISIRKEISFDEAMQLAQEYVSAIKRELREKGGYHMLAVGNFIHNSESTISFEPDYKKNYLKSAFGLHPISVIPIAKAQIKPREKELNTLNSASNKKSKIRKLKNQYRLAIAAAALPLGLYLAYILFQTELLSGKQFAFADLNPFTDKICKVYKERGVFASDFSIDDASDSDSFLNQSISKKGILKFYVFEKDEALYDSNKFLRVRLLSKADYVAESTRVEIKKPDTSLKAQSSEYHVITGCFGVKENADKFVSKLSDAGYTAYILDYHKGLYRVSVGGFYSKTEALDTLPKLREQINQGAWLVKSKRAANEF